MKETATIHFFAGSWKSEVTRRRESSWWWKCIVAPLSVISHKFEKWGGKPYKWFLENTWEKVLQSMSDE